MSKQEQHAKARADEKVVCPQCKHPSPGPIRFASTTEFPSFCTRCFLPLLIIARKYVIEKKLGEGGGGVVYLARHMHLTMEPLRVIKFINPKLLESDIAQQRFNREIQVTSVLSQDNQHIVRVFDDFGVVAGLGHFYVMEFLDGQDLSVVLHRRPLLSREEVFQIVRQLCEAVGPAHEVEIIHRDLKPSNIILTQKADKSLFVKVTDFGLAKHLAGERVTLAPNRTIGTPLYMAPEQFEGSHHIDHRVDLYSIGTILYELLLGHNPFIKPDQAESLSLLELARLKFNNKMIPIDSHYAKRRLSPKLQALLRKSLALSPDDRFQTAAEFLQELKALKQDFVTPDEEKEEIRQQNIRDGVTPLSEIYHFPSTDSLEKVPLQRAPSDGSETDDFESPTPTQSSTQLEALQPGTRKAAKTDPFETLAYSPNQSHVIFVDLEQASEAFRDEEDENAATHFELPKAEEPLAPPSPPKLQTEDAAIPEVGELIKAIDQREQKGVTPSQINLPAPTAPSRRAKPTEAKESKAVAVATPRGEREGHRVLTMFPSKAPHPEAATLPSVMVADEMQDPPHPPTKARASDEPATAPDRVAVVEIVPHEGAADSVSLRNVFLFVAFGLLLLLLFSLFR